MKYRTVFKKSLTLLLAMVLVVGLIPVAAMAQDLDSDMEEVEISCEYVVVADAFAYALKQYTITFDTDGGNADAAVRQDYGTPVLAPKDPTKEGYIFAGWDKEIPETMPAEDLTITALWTEIPAEETMDISNCCIMPCSVDDMDGDLENSFTDVSADAFYPDAVAWAAQRGITNGTGNGSTFAPEEICTRGQAVTFLWRAAGMPEPTTAQNPFKDVNSGDYFCKAVLWALEQGITTGTGDGTTFEPNSVCTRAQIVTMLARYLNGTAKNTNNPFVDVPAGAYYTDAVLWAVENEITNGTGDGTTFEPNTTCSRAHIVTFLFRALDK